MTALTHTRPRRRSPARPPLVLVVTVAALVLLLPTGAVAGLFSSSRSSGSGSSYRPSSSSSSSYKPVSSGYGYRPTYKPSGTPTFNAPKPGASAPFSSASYAPPSNFGNSFLGGRPGAGSYGTGGSSYGYRPSSNKPLGYPAAGGAAGLATAGGAASSSSSMFKPSRPSKMTSLAVPFAVGAGAGALTSAAFRSGSKSCGQGGFECFQSGCDQARRQCAPAARFRLRRVRCPDSSFSECWAAGGDSMFADGKLDQTESPAFLCMGKARPRSKGDVVAQCFNYQKAKNAAQQQQDDDHITAEQLLAGDPALPTTKAFAAPAGAYPYNGAGAVGRGGGMAVVVAAVAVAFAVVA
jgi:hypothetical protein